MKKSDDYNIDKFYKNSFENGNYAFDKDQMWSDIEPRLPGKGRNLFFWFNFALSFLLCIYFGWSMSWSSQHVEKHTIQNTSSAEEYLSKNERKAEASSIQSQNNTKKTINNNLKSSPAILTEDQNEAPSVKKAPVHEGAISAPLMQEQAGFTSTTIFEKLPSHNNISALNVSDPLLPSSTSLNTSKVPSQHIAVKPDPNRWSRCNIKDRPIFLSDIYFFGGYPLIFNKRNPDPEINYEGFLDQWNAGETPVANYGFGWLVGIASFWGGSFSTGLEFQQIQNKIRRSQTVIERVTVYDDMAYYYLDSNNNRIWVGDSVTSTRIYTRELQAPKTHTLINFPLILGYHQEFNNLRVGVSAGVNVHLLHQFTGKSLDPSRQVIDVSTGSSTAIYDTEMGFSLIGGIDLGYFVTLQTEIYVSPRFRYNPKSWLFDAHPLESRIQLINLQAGARWHF